VKEKSRHKNCGQETRVEIDIFLMFTQKGVCGETASFLFSGPNFVIIWVFDVIFS
jgi:hypothetical protein